MTVKKKAKKKTTKKKSAKKKTAKKKSARKRTSKKKDMRVVYGVSWIEVDFGRRPEGYSLFMDKDKCIKDTKDASARGRYSGGGGYCGPERPLTYVEIPFDSLEPEYQERLEEHGACSTSNWWSPKFTGGRISIS